jgi:acyl carrier protein
MDIEQELQAIVRKKVKEDFGASTKLADAGLDSLDVIELAFDIEDEFGIQLPQVGNEAMSLTFGELARLVEQQLAAKGDATVVTPRSRDATPS